ALSFPKYAQDSWVGLQHYNERSWEDVLALWHAYNLHLAHVISRIPESRRQVPCTIESSTPVTLGFLASDYVAHLRHHLAQVDALWSRCCCRCSSPPARHRQSIRSRGCRDAGSSNRADVWSKNSGWRRVAASCWVWAARCATTSSSSTSLSF